VSWYHWNGEGYKERGECSGNIMYSCIKNGKMRSVETIPGMGGGG
jgi:hypothetical protein